MSIERAAEYRSKAADCVKHAQRASHPGDKANWLQMAEGWQRMAENVNRRDIIAVDPDRLSEQQSSAKSN